MADIQDIATYTFTSEARLFFDANIWLLIYGPQGDPQDSRVRTYSLALRKIINGKSRLYIDALVLSEFANRYARIEFDSGTFSTSYANYKQFRNSVDFKALAPTIALVMRNIVDDCECVDCGLPSIDKSALFERFATGDHDFNDLLLTELCTTNDLTLVTDDRDFRDASISVLTSNRSLLSL